jgi:hypothetical protein
VVGIAIAFSRWAAADRREAERLDRALGAA